MNQKIDKRSKITPEPVRPIPVPASVDQIPSQPPTDLAMSIARMMGRATPAAQAYNFGDAIPLGGSTPSGPSSAIPLGGPMDDPNAMPMIPLGGPRPVEPSQIKPVNIDEIDGQTHLSNLITAAMRAKPGESASQMARKINKLNEFRAKASQLGQMTREQAEQMFFGWYDTVAPQPSQFASFTPEYQAALGEAYMTPPQRRVAGIEDVDGGEAATLAGLAIANMITGRGNLGDTLRQIPMLKERQQMRLDADFQNQLSAYESNRQMALQKLGRIREVEDFNAKQQGFEAHDERMIDKQNQAAADREALAASNDERRVKREIGLKVLDAIREMDPVRAAPYHEMALALLRGEEPPASMQNLEMTGKQRNVEADTEQKQANTRYRNELTSKLKFENELDANSFDEQLDLIRSKSKKGDLEVQRLQFEVDNAPEMFRAKIAQILAAGTLSRARASAAIKSADAAMVRAQKTGTTSSGEMTTLKGIIASTNTSYDNKRMAFAELADELADLQHQIQVQKAVDPDADTSAIEREVAEKQKQMADMEKQLNEERARIDKAIKRMAELGGFKMGADNFPSMEDLEKEVPALGILNGLTGRIGPK